MDLEEEDRTEAAVTRLIFTLFGSIRCSFCLITDHFNRIQIRVWV